MGTGKTVTGKLLAKKLSRKYFDLDELIEEKEKISIPEIFSQNGEAYFRRLEKEALKDISNDKEVVVSCGGGIVIDKDNIDVMKKSGIMICLTASADVILERTRAFSHRPLLKVANPKEKIESLLKERAPFYALADNAIDTSNISIKEVVDKITEFLNIFRR